MLKEYEWLSPFPAARLWAGHHSTVNLSLLLGKVGTDTNLLGCQKKTNQRVTMSDHGLHSDPASVWSLPL